jgi:AcrR family transcriptional regulator
MKILSGTKLRILEAALKILECKGIQALTQTAVANDVGIPQGQLTYHFKKRADLVNAVANATLDAMADTVFQKEFRDVADGKELGPFLKLLQGFLKSKSRARALFGLMLEADENSEVKDKVLEQGAKVRTMIATVTRLEDADPLVSMFHSILLGYGLQYFLVEDKALKARLDADFESNLRTLITLMPKNRRKKGE